MDQGKALPHRKSTGIRLAPSHAQHAFGIVDAGDLQSSLSQRQSDAAGATSELKHTAAGFARKMPIEGNIATNRCAPYVESVIGPHKERVGVLVKLVHGKSRVCSNRPRVVPGATRLLRQLRWHDAFGVRCAYHRDQPVAVSFDGQFLLLTGATR